MKKNLSYYLLLLFGLFLVLSACSLQSTEDSSSVTHTEHGDIREKTLSKNELPKFLQSAHQEIQTIYQLAANHEHVLKYIPCYCGCALSANHKNNYDCFIYEQSGHAVVWDDHGTKCNVCLEIANQSIYMFQQGHSVKEIRQAIDSIYQEGYAPPTPTPFPS
jgi:hypothetical protein